MTQERTVLKEDLEKFVKLWQEKSNSYHDRMGYNWYEPLTISIGKRYAKIINNTESQRSAHGFVDLANGDILKTASWSAPAKKARGNIFSEQVGMEAIDQHGFVRYL